MNEAPLIEVRDFVIDASEYTGKTIASISPDQGTCHDCLEDMSDPASPYYKYAFTNCTNCGPRFSILKLFLTIGQ
ncbi:hypothetical protein [Vibrio variabilis]|uniref:hypothetical protein n=1 Tax=Vibrio variabilis TaxID=990271 RepID=UPI000DD8B91E